MTAVVVLAICDATTAQAIDVDEVLWGFDGHATRNAFVPLSVLITNRDPEVFDGVLELRESLGAGQEGATIREDVYLARSTSRWVQFYPYVKDRWNDWSLHWGRRMSQKSDISRPRLGPRATIALVSPEAASNRTGSLKAFPDNLFPPMVTATDSLAAIVLDHAPRWEEPRRQAFYDWLCRGGQLHLLKGTNGEYPKFSGSLSELNTRGNRLKVGAGLVLSHDLPLSQVDRRFIEKLVTTAATVQADAPVPQPATPGKRPGKRVPEQPSENDDDGNRADLLVQDFAGDIFSFLRPLSNPHHNWPLLYFMAGIYTLAIFPGLFLAGRLRWDYRLVYGLLLGVIAAFSVAFAFVGRRGHDEVTALNTVAVASALPGGGLDVTSWSNAFVVNGGVYTISHAGTGRLYATAQSVQTGDAVIRNGAQGQFEVDIPTFSSRAFITRMKVQHDPFDVKIVSFVGDNRLSKLILSTGSNFPRPIGPNSLRAVYRDQILELNAKGSLLELKPGSDHSLSSFLGGITPGPVVADMEYRIGRGPPPYEHLYPRLIAWSLGLNHRDELARFSLPDDRIRLLVAGELPAALAVQNQRLSGQQGRILYVIDVLKAVSK